MKYVIGPIYKPRLPKNHNLRGLDRWQRSPTGNLYIKHRQPHIVAIVCLYKDKQHNKYKYLVRDNLKKSEKSNYASTIEMAIRCANALLIHGV